jgi:ABC-2 type transport system ATP-binding protein
MSGSNMGTAIEVRGLKMAYGPIEAVRGIDLDVPSGGVFALLGPNGAGKTTTVEILEGYRRRTGGSVSVLGHDPAHGGAAFRTRIGIVLQECAIEPYLTVTEVLQQRSRYYPHPRSVDEVLRLVDLESKARARVRVLSGGQQRRLDLALALVGDPDLIFLDEPTTGFDPSARRAAWDVIGNLSTLGKTILLTTHYMDEAQALAARVAVLAAGRIVAQGTPDSLGGRDHARTRVRFRVPDHLARRLPTVSRPVLASSPGGEVTLATDDPTDDLRILTSWAYGCGIALDGLEVTRPSLEDIYLQLTTSASLARAANGSTV